MFFSETVEERYVYITYLFQKYWLINVIVQCFNCNQSFYEYSLHLFHIGKIYSLEYITLNYTADIDNMLASCL